MFILLLLLPHISRHPPVVTEKQKHNHFREFQGMIDLWDVLIELISHVYIRVIASTGLLIRNLTYFQHSSRVLLLISLSVCFCQTFLFASSVLLNPTMIFLHG